MRTGWHSRKKKADSYFSSLNPPPCQGCGLPLQPWPWGCYHPAGSCWRPAGDQLSPHSDRWPGAQHRCRYLFLLRKFIFITFPFIYSMSMNQMVDNVKLEFLHITIYKNCSLLALAHKELFQTFCFLLLLILCDVNESWLKGRGKLMICTKA